MSNPSKQTNPLDYPRYVRGIRPADPNSLALWVEDELEKLQNSTDNQVVAAVADTDTKVATTAANAQAALEVEKTARQALEATVGTNTAAIVSEQTVRANADTALASSITSLTTTVSGNTAAIISEANTRATADSAIASDVTTLTTNVGTLTGTVSTYSSAIAGVQARYGVTLDVNGYATGFSQNNSGTSSDFIVRADFFKIINPGFSPTVVFEVSGGVTRIKNAVIGSGNVGTTNLADNSVTNTVYAVAAPSSNSGSGLKNILDVTITTIGGPVRIDFTLDMSYADSINTTHFPAVSILHVGSGVTKTQRGFLPYKTYYSGLSSFVFDTQAAGTHTYRMQFLNDGFTYSLQNGAIAVTELRK